MVTKKLSTTIETGASGTETNQQADGQAVTQSGAALVPPPIPEPIVATDDHGRQRPMSGGSFVRNADGSIARNEEQA